VAVLKSEDERVAFYVTPVAVEFEDENPRWLEYEMGFHMALEQGAQLVAGSEGLSLSMMESELVEFASRLQRLLEGLSSATGEAPQVVCFEGTDPDFNLHVRPQPAVPQTELADGTRIEQDAGAAEQGGGLEFRVEVLVDLTSLQRTGAARSPGRAHVGFHFYTTASRLDEFVSALKQEYERATGEEFVLRHDLPLPTEVPFSRILNLFNRKDWTHRHTAVRLLQQAGDARSVTLLLQALGDANGWVRESAVEALRGLTGQDFGFEPFALGCERRQPVRRWQEWWQANRLSFAAAGAAGDVES
jgi:hypothetical protein